jgi:hypothetical protein
MSIYRAYIIDGGTDEQRKLKATEIFEGNDSGLCELFTDEAKPDRLGVLFAEVKGDMSSELTLADVELIVTRRGNDEKLPDDYRATWRREEPCFGIITLK